MKRKFSTLLLCMIMVAAMTTTAHADIGPKASVRITFTGLGNEICYGTLLSEKSSTGPSSAWNGDPAYAHYKPDEAGYEIWKAFVDYEDADGYYFLQEWWDCTETHQLNWTYRPPSVFKILLYFPETDTFAVSPIYEEYAFDSYFTVHVSDSGELQAEKSYDYTWEIISLVARIILTILLEIGIAWLFGFREKRMLRFITLINIITQIVLNVWLNIVNYQSGSLSFTFMYVLLEIAVFAMEAVVYALAFQRISDQPQKRGKAVGYAFVANAVSFAVGMGLAHLIPGIF